MGNFAGIGARRALVALFVAGAAFVVVTELVSGEAAKRGGIRFATTGNHSELIGKLPITRRAGQKPRVVMSLGPRDLPRLHRGDVLETASELQITTTCYLPERRCIGRRYRFSPKTTARVLLARSGHATGGRGTEALSRRQSIRCHQRRPNRNHHCVFAFHTRLRVDRPSRLPCPRERCSINFVAQAHHPRARHGNVEIMGADTPSGHVRDDSGRLSAAVLRQPRNARTYASRRERRRRLPLGSDHPNRVVYSVKVPHPKRGQVLVALARERTGLDGLPYPAFIGSSLILAKKPTAARPGRLAASAGTTRGTLDEATGFNCTHGPSAYRTPCRTRKAGAVRIRRSVHRGGHPIPLYVNLVSHGLAKVAQPPKAGGGEPRVLNGGFLRVKRYSRARR